MQRTLLSPSRKRSTHLNPWVGLVRLVSMARWWAFPGSSGRRKFYAIARASKWDVSGWWPSVATASLPLINAQNRQTFFPAGVTFKTRPPPSVSLKCFSLGFAALNWFHVSGVSYPNCVQIALETKDVFF